MQEEISGLIGNVCGAVIVIGIIWLAVDHLAYLVNY
jgi:hypothetical protein